MPVTQIRSLFASNIDRRIEEVIKVDQTDEELLREEISEYVTTDAIRDHYRSVLEAYAEIPNKPGEGIGVWVSGFFGSGKSSFAKMLGLSIENRMLDDIPAGKRFADRAGDPKLNVLLTSISEKIPTHAVIFDVSTDRGIKSGNQSLTEIAYRLFLESLGYAKDLDLSELEIALESEDRLDEFKDIYRREFNKEWDADKGLVAFSMGRASRVMHLIDPATYPSADSWTNGVKDRSDVSPNKLADRAMELMKRRRPGKSLLFVVDEVGQFVARDVQKMLDLQAFVQSIGRVGRGKHWLVVTSQEKLGELVSGLDDKQIELARLMDRFPQQVHLEPSDISEVTSRRVLSKNAEAEATLGTLFDQNRARLTESIRLSADIRLPELTRQGFIDLYPLLPYQIDLIIQVVSGLRTQGGASKHVGGANRTIIKLAQQVLINPNVDLASAGVGALARLDQIYDLVEGNIASDVRAKISSIPTSVRNAHGLAEPVAKVICLLQFVQSVHRTAENIAACLHPGVASDSQLAGVKEAIAQLEAARLVRAGDDGYRIPTPAEDDWERVRSGSRPTPGDIHRLHTEVITSFWQLQPAFNYLNARMFKAGLAVRGRTVSEGDISFQIQLVDDRAEYATQAAELRARSQEEPSTVFWLAVLNDAIDGATVEIHRSNEVLSRKERDARTGAETSLIAEEKLRLRRHQEELRRLLREALLNGTVYFRGNDRSPTAGSADVARSAVAVLEGVVPEIFDRFDEAAAKQADVKKGLDALLMAEDLQGLPTVFASLGLVRSENGKTVIDPTRGPLHEVAARIEARYQYGETVTGRYLADAFAAEPFGWDFEVVRLLVLSLVRSGAIEVTSKGQVFESATGPEAKETFSNNNLFRAAAFRPKKGINFDEIVRASGFCKDTFGSEAPELNAGSVSRHIRAEVDKVEDGILEALTTLTTEQLPGSGVLQAAIGPMREIARGSDDAAIISFNGTHASIKEAIRRAAELDQALTEPRLLEIRRAVRVLRDAWPFLRDEADVGEDLMQQASALEDLLKRETFFKELPAVDQHATAIEAAFAQRHGAALADRAAAYTNALDHLAQTPGWLSLDEIVRDQIAAPLVRCTITDGQEHTPVSLLRADLDACSGRLASAVELALKAIDGDRLVSLSLAPFFLGGIETEEQLEQALDGIRDECARLIGAGKKIVVK
jgi:uncharacterized protein DUF6079